MVMDSIAKVEWLSVQKHPLLIESSRTFHSFFHY
jgi:hypothetical protein